MLGVIFVEYVEVCAEQKHLNLVNLVKSFTTSISTIYIQQSASIQAGTSRSKFANTALKINHGNNTVPVTSDIDHLLYCDELKDTVANGYHMLP